MFTGLVRHLGHLIDPPKPSEHGGVVLRIGHPPSFTAELQIGASVAVSGVCLTVTALAPGEITVELSPETLARTTLQDLAQGSPVNLEPALKMGDALGGHWVQGHVDTTLDVVGRKDLEEHRELAFALPDNFAAFVVEKGSVTLDGVSLTVAHLLDDPSRGGRFTVALIPHTLEVTTLNALTPGDRVNFEVDVLAKYVQRAIQTAHLVPGPRPGEEATS